MDFREEKAMTTREVQNRATDQQGSTTEASDQDSDPGSCATGVKSNRHELASAVESEAMPPPPSPKAPALFAAGAHLVPDR